MTSDKKSIERLPGAVSSRGHLGSMQFFAERLANIISFGLLSTSLGLLQPSMASEATQLTLTQKDSTMAPRPEVGQPTKLPPVKLPHASDEVRHLAAWVMDSADNRSMPFAIVDKKAAQVFVFYPDGRFRGTAPVLLGLAVGDDSVPGIGNRPLSSIRPEERTTPAGRFVAALDFNAHNKEILWVDYDGAISMHPVVTNKPQERRLQRLATATPLDNRISYGCINVPTQFFKKVVRPAFTGTNGIVYVLPEIKSVSEVFGLMEKKPDKAAGPIPIK